MALPDPSENSNEILLKTIRLSKNMFSLTERLPKAQYRSPRVFSMANDNSSGSLLPNLNNGRNHNVSTIQPPNHGKSVEKPSLIFEGENKALYKHGKPKSRLQDHGDGNAASGGYEEEEFDGSNEGLINSAS